MDNTLSLPTLVTAAVLYFGSTASAAEDPSTWMARLSQSAGQTIAVGSGESTSIDPLLEPPMIDMAQAATPSSGWTELTGSLIACGLLYRVLRRRRMA